MKYRVTITRSLDETACQQMADAGLSAPTLDGPNVETLEVEAPREGLAKTRAMNETSLVFRGHFASYDVQVIA